MPSNATLESRRDPCPGEAVTGRVNAKVKKAHSRVHGSEPFEEGERFVTRVHLRERVSGPVGVVGEEERSI
jgi:hypothetical protein